MIIMIKLDPKVMSVVQGIIGIVALAGAGAVTAVVVSQASQVASIRDKIAQIVPILDPPF